MYSSSIDSSSSRPATWALTGTPASARAKEAADKAAMVSEPSAASTSTFNRTANGNGVDGKAAESLLSSIRPVLRLTRCLTGSGMRSLPDVLA